MGAAVYRDGSELVISPTDLTKFLACEHLTSLDLAVATGLRPRPASQDDEALELLFRKGLEHEHRYLDSLRAAGPVTEIEQGDLAAAVTATERAMANGAEVIYQATFRHGGHRGHADFLLRVARPSRLGPFAYDVADTKLARRLKVPALLQMAEYGEHLHRIQGVPPAWLTVVAGDGVAHSYRYADVESYYRRLSGRFTHFRSLLPATAAVPVGHCEQCRWVRACVGEWRSTDDLTFVAFMRSDHRAALRAAGVDTLTRLAECTADELPRTIGRTSRQRLVAQAALQLAERRTGRPRYELLPAEAGIGLLRLPEPDPGDLYLDFEGDPYVEPSGREYLAGLGDRAGGFEALWAHSAEQERVLTENLVDRLLSHWRAHPGMHVYHYAPYERSALQRLTARHGVREAELDVLLRAEVLVDLYAVVRQGLRISKESYSIKKLEAFYWGHTRGAAATDPDVAGADVADADVTDADVADADVADAMSSVIAYENWLVDPDPAILDAIERYNAADVRSTLALHDWLEQRRAELSVRTGESLPRPGTDGDRADAEPDEAELAENALAEKLLAADQPLFAGLVGWHRREARPGWWDFFRRAEFDDEELIEDGTAIGGLGPAVHVRDVKLSRVWRAQFPPQDLGLRVGDTVVDVDTRENAGTIEALSPEEGWIELRLGRKREPAHSRGLQPNKPVVDTALRESIADSARRALAGEVTLAARLLQRRVPAALPVRSGEDPQQAVVRIGRSLDGEVLAVQGPPGTGKSTAGAALIRALLDTGLRVGITALSHSVIGNLLAKVDRPALQKATEEQWCGADSVAWTADNGEVAAALSTGRHRLVGGTAWLWSRPELAGAVDVLLVDEAGQFSLANTVAVSRAAHSLVLLGDPQQLSQPTQAEHPYGAGVSALEHLLEGHDTVPPERGVFLDTTWRMHPELTSFVSDTSYEGRLTSGPGRERQEVHGGRWCGSGLRYQPVVHLGNEADSVEEAAVVAELVTDLLGAQWTDHDGRRQPITPADLLVVAPYNAHVGRLRTVVPAGVQVGTVDKFQGREAAVVIYSLASSSAADAPRGVDFLYDIHRLNVAVSRARALTILVASPRLLDAEVHSPQQLRQVNALCRYVERARHPDDD
ncbi:TM0106 family RecB-like putative nuclease [Jatrophihabitans telluris]|uniref:TM0106 family RecB-like putative nuclease n=1 Tax=Jatrophihabitans telluris TaxID=2038343 RepID=A0ABY4QZL5_9ACTN|nr:TM0106 family RecB-like putative nuclease [Jatrophihabitans telluris]UQX89073.1 TM0106 family RecB-like putative nuclease [Jatrophihabitans telluris]